MKILVSGSLAYDFVMDFPDSFKNHIMPDSLHILNVCFMIEKLNKGLGGTAGNIAYNFKLLGMEPEIFSALGKDADEYLKHFEKNKIRIIKPIFMFFFNIFFCINFFGQYCKIFSKNMMTMCTLINLAKIENHK